MKSDASHNSSRPSVFPKLNDLRDRITGPPKDLTIKDLILREASATRTAISLPTPCERWWPDGSPQDIQILVPPCQSNSLAPVLTRVLSSKTNQRSSRLLHLIFGTESTCSALDHKTTRTALRSLIKTQHEDPTSRPRLRWILLRSREKTRMTTALASREPSPALPGRPQPARRFRPTPCVRVTKDLKLSLVQGHASRQGLASPTLVNAQSTRPESGRSVLQCVLAFPPLASSASSSGKPRCR